ncbi:uncharacterized protein K441DRAFT_370695 [Cenococcum geophilum 1.58]|uniref:uncharacterized protein n=1 Tax=Cenococcum geophilum 1.58 TaxID=794803 RepID=UPI00358E4FD3|nr:hypothetical protein K441DRAFT_370695 [Cenococcum geophilum 1.58]
MIYPNKRKINLTNTRRYLDTPAIMEHPRNLLFVLYQENTSRVVHFSSHVQLLLHMLPAVLVFLCLCVVMVVMNDISHVHTLFLKSFLIS